MYQLHVHSVSSTAAREYLEIFHPQVSRWRSIPRLWGAAVVEISVEIRSKFGLKSERHRKRQKKTTPNWEFALHLRTATALRKRPQTTKIEARSLWGVCGRRVNQTAVLRQPEATYEVLS